MSMDMNFNWRTASRRRLVGILIWVLGFAPALVYAQEGAGTLVTNIDWSIQNEQIVVTYDLNAEPDEDFSVEITLLNDEDADFHVTPLAVKGDVGMVKGGGKDKRIFWDFRKDLDYGLEGGKYYFAIHTKKIEGSQPWKYIAIGAGVAAGGVLALILINNAGGDPSGGGVLPMPPGRP